MNIMVELALIFGVCLAGEGISAVLPFAFPASVIAMLLLGALLFFKILKTRHIERASHFLAGNMAFFFLPTCVGVMEHADAILGQLAPFLLVSFLTVPLIYCVTAWVVQLLIRLTRKGGGSHA